MPGELVETPCDSLGSGHSSIVTGLPNWEAGHQLLIVNPSYTTYIALRNPEVCPLGTMALYLHWLHDLYELPKKMSIDWESSKSWQNVDSSDIAKLGWSRGTYMDTYAPALPKNVHENYDPIWRHVHVPEAFLSRMCPNAESILEKIEGTNNLTGASNYWQMLIELRPYKFQCAAAIYQVQPKSALFKLLALQNPDVRNWMSSVFPVDLKRLKDSEKEPLDLARIQNEALCLSLEEVRVQLVQQTRILERMEQKFERRTAVFSPAKGYSNEAYARSAEISNAQTLSFLQSDDNPFVVHTHAQISDPPSTIDAETRACEDTGLYEADDCSIQALSCNLVWPPIFGQKYVAWPEIFPLIHNPQSLFGSVGEATEGPIPGQKPPLRLVEQYFKAKWRSTAKSRKFWERFREILEWIETEASINSKSPEASIGELEALRNHLAKRSVAAAAAAVGTTGPVDSSDNLASGNGDGAEATSSSTIPAKRIGLLLSLCADAGPGRLGVAALLICQ
ncbi:hypothetical protein C8J57DRAFT_1247075 [Mycena rebaudengoi]|nr:hypothetical protein C8J57DRAFT_1247075 [Mycena rebaudengoi]